MLKRVRKRSALVDTSRSRADHPDTTGSPDDSQSRQPRRRLIGIRRSGLWRHADFLRFWAADAVSETGSQVTLLALPLLAAISLGATPAQMGFLAAAGTAPNLVFGLILRRLGRPRPASHG